MDKKLYKETDTILLVTRPFLPCENTDKMDCNFYFMPVEHVDYVSLCEISKAYTDVYIEEVLAEKISAEGNVLPEKVSIIENCVDKIGNAQNELKLAFLAGNDTHVNFMSKLAKEINNHIFLIPEIRIKNEGAAAALDMEGEKYIEVLYGKRENVELMSYNPQYIFSGADWTSEYNEVQKVIRETDIRAIALQEGPQDWHIRIRTKKGENVVMKKLNHYRVADIQFLQGARVLSFIRPKYFTVTGNPKVDVITECQPPSSPKVFINCNFTYADQKPSYESHGVEWVKSIIRVCQELDMDYLISQHPRDISEWDDEHLVKSNAYKVAQQIEDCSICISRFSNIPYEAYARSREVLYYNVHREPMPIFVEDQETEIPVVDTEEELKEILLNHKQNYPYVIDKKRQELFLHRHIGKPDGKARQRIIANLKEMGVNKFVTTAKIDELTQSRESICDDKINKTIAVYADFNKKEYTNDDYMKMFIVETLAMLGYKTYVVTNAYSKCYHMFSALETHKDIVVELAHGFKFEFEQVDFDEVLYLGSDVEEEQIKECAKALCEKEEAVWNENINIEDCQRIVKEIIGNDNFDAKKVIQDRNFWHKLVCGIKELLQ